MWLIWLLILDHDQAVAHNITATLESSYTPEERENVVILFSAHSLPLSVVKSVGAGLYWRSKTSTNSDGALAAVVIPISLRSPRRCTL